MKSQYLKTHRLPDVSGIYIFRDYRKRPIYIGRATSLKDRVKSYFSNDLIETRGPRIVDMVTKAKSISWQETASVLEAVLLESMLIKRYHPHYNVAEKDDKSSLYVVITDESWPRVFLARARDLEQSEKNGSTPFAIKRSFGPFVETALIKEALKILRKMFPFRDKKANDPRHEAFYRAIGRSPVTTSLHGDNDTSARRRYLRTIRYLTLFFEGHSERVRKLVARDMNHQSKALLFEEAALSRKLLYALDHINDIALIKKDVQQNVGIDHRIEAFDVAHLSGTNVVGSMAVIENGELRTSEYRKFKITREANDDLAGLIEILSRRLNHPEWRYPDIIVVDGNDMHIRAAESVLKARRIDIPVVAVTKDASHKAAKLVGHQDIVKMYRTSIIAANSEAHRFAIAYHRARRSLL